MSVADKLAILMTMSWTLPPGNYTQMDLPAAGPQVTIEDQIGGDVRAHVAQVVDYDRQGTRLRVTGACISACTLILALPPGRICVGPNARFGFHQPFTQDRRGKRENQTAEAAAMTDVYPPFVQQWLKSHFGGLPPGRPQFMGYDVLRSHYATCG